MNIVHITGDSQNELNSSNWRGRIQAEALRRVGHNVYLPHVDLWFKNSPRLAQMCANADIIIVERVLVEESIDRVAYWRERGKSICIDLDDSYSRLAPEKESGNQASKFWNRGEVDIHLPGGSTYTKKLSTHPLEQFAKAAQMYCSGLTMPSRVLMEDWKWTAPCYYIPNYIDSPRYLRAKLLPRPPSDDLIIGWGGSMSHLPSFKKSGILEGLRQVFKKRKHVKFLLAGDERLLPLLPIPAARKIYQPYVMFPDWPKVMRRMDIVVAPLFGIYDWSRSFIKSSEASLMGLPLVATGCPTYKDFMDAGVGIYVDDGPDTPEDYQRRADEWAESLLGVIDHYPEHKATMDAKLEFAMSFDIDANVDKIVATYQEIIDKDAHLRNKNA